MAGVSSVPKSRQGCSSMGGSFQPAGRGCRAGGSGGGAATPATDADTRHNVRVAASRHSLALLLLFIKIACYKK